MIERSTLQRTLSERQDALNTARPHAADETAALIGRRRSLGRKCVRLLSVVMQAEKTIVHECTASDVRPQFTGEKRLVA